ncbi:MAG: hypothetical protein Q7W51_10970 [Coriobacteriia bacterium]|nr:hypothetical protein [Coriobacteriia bacterium]
MMRDKRLLVLAFVLAGMLALTGCGGSDAEEAESDSATETSEAEAATTEAEADAGALPVIDASTNKTGWALVSEKCTVCHPITTVDEARLDWSGWTKAVDHMLENGAQLTEEEKATVLEYLTTREQVKLYGASEVQQECMVCHTTERVNAAVLDWTGWEVAVDHMIENGAQIDDTQKAVIIEYLAIRGPQG